MRWVVPALSLLALAGVAQDSVAPLELAPDEELEIAIRTEPASEFEMPAMPTIVNVVDVLPVGDRVAQDASIVVRFDRPVPPGQRHSIVGVTPAVPLTASWPSADVVELRPTHWRAGRPHRVRVTPPGGDALEWTFRARVPKPDNITPGEGSRIILSFDDGPNDRKQADRLLDQLRDLKIRALLFPSGHWAQKRKDWIERAKREGHRVCNHTFSHINLTAPWMTDQRIVFEIGKGAGDGECRWFRPPLLGIDARVERIAEKLGYEILLWDIDSRDWEGAPADDILHGVTGMARPNAVVLFHMHSKATTAALPELAATLRSAGYVLSWDPHDVVEGGIVESPTTRLRPIEQAEGLEDIEDGS